MEKYREIFLIKKPLYTPNSPVLIEKVGAFFSQAKNAPIILCKFQNLTENVITDVQVVVTIYSKTGRHKDIPYAYSGYTVAPNQSFGGDSPIHIEYKTFVKCFAKVTEVTFADGTKWTADEDAKWGYLRPAKLISSVLPDAFQRYGYRERFGAKAKYAYEQRYGMHFCACGAINSSGSSRCKSCGALFAHFEQTDPAELRKFGLYKTAIIRLGEKCTNKRLLEIKEVFKKLNDYRDSQSYVKKIDALLDARLKRKRKIRKRWIKSLTAIVSLAVVTTLVFTVVVPLIRLNEADKLVNEGKYEEAMEIYQDVDAFDSEQRVTLLMGIKQVDEKDFEEGVWTILSAGVPVQINYGIEGGDFTGTNYVSAPMQENNHAIVPMGASATATDTSKTVVFTYNTLEEFFGIKTPGKKGYRFVRWDLVDYTYQIDGTFELDLKAVWSEKDYTITYDLKGGTLTRKNPEIYGIEDNSFTLQNPTKAGYTFIGWTGTDLTSHTISVTVKKGSVGDRTYTANWSANSYTITFNAAGGAVSSTSKTVIYDTVYTLPTPTKTGYTFLGWYNGNTKYTGGTWTRVSNITLTARWQANTYTVTYANTKRSAVEVTFDPNYSGVATSTVTLTDGQKLNYPTVPTRNGYAFAGWYTDSACTTQYGFSGTITEDMTLYAGWTSMTTSYSTREYVDIANHTSSATAKSVSVTASSISSQNYCYFTCYKTGSYTFYSSYTSGDFYITVYNVTKSSTIVNEYNLYSSQSSKSASFTANAGDVIYVSFYNYDSTTNSGCNFYVSGAGYPTSSATASTDDASEYVYAYGKNIEATVTFGENCTLLTPTRTGYAFLGWYNGSQKVESGDWNIPSNVTLTPKWEAIKKTITLNAAGGTLSTTSISVTYDKTYTLPTPTRTGYTFLGWYNGDTNYTGGMWTGLSNITLTARWQANTYTVTYANTKRSAVEVTFDPNYSGAATSTVTLTDGQTLSCPTVPTRNGYVFAGWYTDSACTTQYGFSGTITEDMTLYASWKTCTITNNSASSWSSSNGVLTSTNKESSSSSTYKITANSPVIVKFSYKTSSESGYDNLFIKKNGSELTSCSGETSYVSYSVVLSTGDYLEFTYSKDSSASNGSDCAYIKDITYEANVSYTSSATASTGGASEYVYAYGESIEATVTFGENCTLPTPTRTGYTFLGWYNGSEQVETGAWSIASNVTLTPKWEVTKNTITLDANGGTVSESSIEVTYGEAYTLPMLERTGYTFEGWYNGDTEYTSGTWEEESDITLTARWQANTYTVTYANTKISAVEVTFDPNYSGAATSTVTLTDGQTLSYPTVPTRSGYAFAGWYTDSACTKQYGFSGTITEDMTLYAGWTSMNASYSTREYVDIANHTSSATAKSVRVTASSSSSQNYYYFTCYKAGTYTLYTNLTSGDFYVTAYNATQNTSIFSRSNLYGSTSSKSASFTANAGDVIYVSFYNYGSTTNSGCNFYVSGAGYPTSSATASIGGASEYVYAYGESIEVTVTFGENCTLPTPTQTGYTFLGWYNGSEQVETGAWSIAEDVTLTAAWESDAPSGDDI